jgi:hypothetical protein
MKKILFAFLIVLCGQLGFAQKVSVSSARLLPGTEVGGFFHPVFSPKGTYLLTTGENYVGLRLHSLATGDVQILTTDVGAGYEFSVSNDETTILFKRTEYENNLRYSSLHQYSTVDKKQLQIGKATREKLTPTFDGNQPAYVKGSTLVKKESKTSVSTTPITITIEDQKMALYSGNKRTVLMPNGADDSYFWASISPDKKHIVYTTAHGGTFVCTINGKKPVSLGKINAPQWLNNQWVIGMDDKDNGEQVLSSTLVAATIDGKVRQTLATPQTAIAMYPAASADGKHVAFNTGEGKVFVLDVSISKK